MTASCITRPSTKKEFCVIALQRLLYAKNHFFTLMNLEFYAYKTWVIFIMGKFFHILKFINKAEKNGVWPSGAFEEMQLFWLCNIRPARWFALLDLLFFLYVKKVILYIIVIIINNGNILWSILLPTLLIRY